MYPLPALVWPHADREESSEGLEPGAPTTREKEASMSDMQTERPGEPGTAEGEAGPAESDPVAPSVEGRDVDETADE